MTYIPQVEQALKDIKSGKPVIIIDGSDREDEGDLMLAAERATPERLAFIAKNARGIMCIPTAKFILDRLQIPMSPTNYKDKFVTPFTLSVDSVHRTTTGVSVSDRMETIKCILDEKTHPDELAYPGHMFPLRPQPGLLDDRQGHTEASIQLCLMAELQPVAIICEIMNDDGSMARLKPDLVKYAKEFNLTIISIDMVRDYCALTRWTPPIQVG